MAEPVDAADSRFAACRDVGGVGTTGVKGVELCYLPTLFASHVISVGQPAIGERHGN